MDELIKRMQFHGWEFFDNTFYAPYRYSMSIEEAQEWIDSLG